MKISSNKSKAVILTLLLSLLCFAIPTDVAAQTNLVKPDQWLALQPKPNFAPGHHLPHLTRWAWGLSSNANIELAKNWGYTLDLGDVNANLLAQIKKTNTMQSRFVYLAKTYPKQYALSVNVPRFYSYIPHDGLTIPDDVWVTNSEGLFVDSSLKTWSSITNKFIAVVSPESPDSFWRDYAEYVAAPLRALKSNNIPVGVILNGGEYGLGVTGIDGKAWNLDPRVAAVKATNNLSFNRYMSNRKAHQLSFLTSAIRDAAPSREYYIFYNTGNEQNRYYFSWCKNWLDSNGAWGWSSDVFNSASDLPSFENYYIGPQSWTNVPGVNWNQINDLLTKHLNAVGYNLKLSNSLNYSWVCGGWSTNANRLSDVERYTGFLKCIYTSGTVGAVAGYFDYPTGGFDVAFPANKPPHWLVQIQTLSHVHALFSKLENYIYKGDLLSGTNMHAWSSDQPAYEFPVGDPNVRVLVRKLRSSDDWLITAWAADGIDRNVKVTIPNLGTIKVLARASGAVYQATKTNLALVDVNGLLPSALRAPSNFQVK